MAFEVLKTTVTLRVGASAERVLIEVQDECGGLPSGDANELFRPFEQRSAKTQQLEPAGKMFAQGDPATSVM